MGEGKRTHFSGVSFSSVHYGGTLLTTWVSQMSIEWDNEVKYWLTRTGSSLIFNWFSDKAYCVCILVVFNKLIGQTDRYKTDESSKEVH